MNISKVIQIAHLIDTNKEITDKIGRKIIEDIVQYLKEYNWEEIEDKNDRDFYTVFIKDALNGEKEVNKITYIFFSAIIIIMNKNRFKIKEISKSTFEQREYIEILLDSIEEVMLELADKYKMKEYIRYEDAYYKKNKKKNYFNYCKENSKKKKMSGIELLQNSV